jgi:hypothetical protein
MPTFAHGEHAFFAGKGRYSGTVGVLYLTNKRILFEYEKGLITRSTYISLDLPLPNIKSVAVERPRFGLAALVTNLIITTKRGSMGFGRNRVKISDLATPDIWATKIDDAISGESAAPEANEIMKEEIVKIPC